MHKYTSELRADELGIYGLPHGILQYSVFNTILNENEFQNPQIFQQTISLFPEQSTLALVKFLVFQD
jgi:hypothetical protein